MYHANPINRTTKPYVSLLCHVTGDQPCHSPVIHWVRWARECPAVQLSNQGPSPLGDIHPQQGPVVLESPRTNGPFRRDGQMERCHEQTLDNEEVVVLASSADDLFYLTSPALQTQHPAPFTMIKQRERGKRREGRGVWWGDRKRGGSELGPYFNSTQLPNLICYSTTYHCCLDRLTALQLQPTALIHNNHHPLLTTLVITVICFLHFL